MPKFKSEQIGIRINNSLRQKLELLAEYDKRTLSDYIRIYLEELVEKEELKGTFQKIKDKKDTES